jgi:hypothetical protein
LSLTARRSGCPHTNVVEYTCALVQSARPLGSPSSSSAAKKLRRNGRKARMRLFTTHFRGAGGGCSVARKHEESVRGEWGAACNAACNAACVQMRQRGGGANTHVIGPLCARPRRRSEAEIHAANGVYVRARHVAMGFERNKRAFEKRVALLPVGCWCGGRRLCAISVGAPCGGRAAVLFSLVFFESNASAWL